MTSGGGTQVLAGHGDIHGPGHQAVLADTNGDALIYHYYANNGASLLGINLHGRRGRNAHAPLTGSDTVPGAGIKRPGLCPFGVRALGGALSVVVSGAAGRDLPIIGGQPVGGVHLRRRPRHLRSPRS